MKTEETHQQAIDCAAYYQIPGQREGEENLAFCQRVSGRLREMGHIVEAHEIAAGKRFDEEGGGAVLTGLSGALAMALHGRQYSRDGQAQSPRIRSLRCRQAWLC